MRQRLAAAALIIVGLTAVGCGSGSSSTSSTPSSSAPSGKTIFVTAGCASCHTLAAAGAEGKVGPDLGKVLKGKSRAFIRQSVVEPNAVIAKGYAAGVMPQDFERALGPAKIDAVVSYLVSVTHR